MIILLYGIGALIGASLFIAPFLWCLCRASSLEARELEMKELIEEITLMSNK